MPIVTKAANSNAVLSGTWTGQTNAYATTGDNSYCEHTQSSRNGTAEIRFGFPSFTTSDIPDGSTINSVKVSAEVGLDQSIGSVIDITIENPSGTDVGPIGEYLNSTVDELIESSASTLPTLTNLRDATVAAHFRYDRANSPTSETIRIDYVSITVDYTAGATVVEGSFTADASVKKIDIAGSFSADASIKRVDLTQQFTADAYVSVTTLASITADAAISKSTSGTFSADANVKRAVGGTFSADAYVKDTFSGSLSADAYIESVVAGNFSADAYVKRSLSGSFAADSHISTITVGSLTADAYIQGAAATAPDWVSPADTVTITATPVLVFTIPSGPVGNYHFHMEIDTAATFDTVDLRSLRTHADQTGWEYDSTGAGDWTPVPSSGVPSTYSGNDCRYTVQSALSNGTWYRRVRAGV